MYNFAPAHERLTIINGWEALMDAFILRFHGNWGPAPNDQDWYWPSAALDAVKYGGHRADIRRAAFEILLKANEKWSDAAFLSFAMSLVSRVDASFWSKDQKEQIHRIVSDLQNEVTLHPEIWIESYRSEMGLDSVANCLCGVIHALELTDLYGTTVEMLKAIVGASEASMRLLNCRPSEVGSEIGSIAGCCQDFGEDLAENARRIVESLRDKDTRDCDGDSSLYSAAMFSLNFSISLREISKNRRGS